MPSINASRHQAVFSPEVWNGRIDVVGAGATGSRIVMALAKLGILGNLIHVWDGDVIESHNIANQIYGLSDIGEAKVTALARLVENQTGAAIVPHNEMVNGRQAFGTVVFLLTDTMASRQEIWKRSIRFKPAVKLMIETRMGSDNGRVYAVEPSNAHQVKGWENTLYGDDQAEVSACGTPITVGATADVISGLAIWQMMRWWSIQSHPDGSEDSLENEILFGLRPESVIIPSSFAA